MFVFGVILMKKSLVYKSKLTHFVISYALKPYGLTQSFGLLFNSRAKNENQWTIALHALPFLGRVTNSQELYGKGRKGLFQN